LAQVRGMPQYRGSKFVQIQALEGGNEEQSFLVVGAHGSHNSNEGKALKKGGWAGPGPFPG